MKDYDRLLRVNELLKRELGELFERHIAPMLKAGLITVTSVKTTPDLRHAAVSFSVLGAPDGGEHALRCLLAQRKFLQDQLAHHVTLKFTPVLQFKLDRTGAKADNVLHLLDELKLPDEEP